MRRDTLKITGNPILITGGTRSIGRALAEALQVGRAMDGMQRPEQGNDQPMAVAQKQTLTSSIDHQFGWSHRKAATKV